MAFDSCACVQATDIDVTSQTACGHGRVTCWTAYGGPDVNFKRDDLKVVPGEVPECVLYVDTYLGGEQDVGAVLGIWAELRSFLERADIPKVCRLLRVRLYIHLIYTCTQVSAWGAWLVRLGS